MIVHEFSSDWRLIDNLNLRSLTVRIWPVSAKPLERRENQCNRKRFGQNFLHAGEQRNVCFGSISDY
jgi:hypothetical protein